LQVTALPRQTEDPFPPPGSERQSPPEVLAAQAGADNSPNDPALQFELALAYWNANMPDPAHETLNRFILLVGAEDAPYYVQTAEKFASMQAWPPAALLYLQAVKFHAARGKVPPELLTPFHEAVYKSADRSEALRVLPVDEIVRVDEPIALILKARHAFFAKDSAQAYRHLEELKKLEPGMHEAILLEAEFYSFDGQPERARDLLRALVSERSVPAWIRIFAEEIMKRYP
jgi:thioredoxin-like negative regulator of GroEL